MADPLGVTASIITILQLSQLVTQTLIDLTSASEDRLRLLYEVIGVSSLLSILKDHAQRVESTDKWRSTIMSLALPKGPLEQFKKALEQVAFKLVPVKGLKKIGKNLIWPFQKTEVLEILNTIERQKSLFALAVENDHM